MKKNVFLWIFMLLTFFGLQSVKAEDNGVSLYTPYTVISVAPGQSIDYSISVINNSEVIKNVRLEVSGLYRSWHYSLKSGAYSISQISVLPGKTKDVTMKVEVPLKVNKGTYNFRVLANGAALLPLSVKVTTQGTYETELATDQPSMAGPSSTTFRYNVTLKNRTEQKQLYSLISKQERGWAVRFKVSGKSVSSVSVDANATKTISMEIEAPSQVEAKSYKIPIRAITSSTSADLVLTAVVTGTYNMELTTPTGRLSDDINTGGEKEIDLVVRNTGSSVLNDIKLSSSNPAGWKVVFKPEKINQLKAGESTHVVASVKASKKSIAGDYLLKMESKVPEKISKANFRISVKTPMLWGWVGILIILLACGCVYYLFRKYGRR